MLLKVSDVHEVQRDKLRAELSGKIAFISFVTVAELLFWAEKYNWGPKRRDELDEKLRPFGVLDPTRDTAELWARARQLTTANGKTLGHHDLWIAAASLEHDLLLLSNDSDFDAIDGLERRPL